MWTGDNLGTWEHMTVGVKMVLANGIAGMTFGGCELLLDVSLEDALKKKLFQLTWVVSLVTPNLRCWSGGTKLARFHLSSGLTRTLTPKGGNPSFSMSHTKGSSEMYCA
jgi:hypothetical protein